MVKKLKKVTYINIDGKLKACELYDDDSIRLVEIKEGITRYILTGESEKKKEKVVEYSQGDILTSKDGTQFILTSREAAIINYAFEVQDE